MARPRPVVVLACMLVLLAACGGLVVAGVRFVVQPVDVAGKAHSAETEAARQAVAAEEEAVLAAAVPPGAVTLGGSLRDVCFHRPLLVGWRPKRAVAACARTVVRYYGFERDDGWPAGWRCEPQLAATAWASTCTRGTDHLRVQWSERPAVPADKMVETRDLPADDQIVIGEQIVRTPALYEQAYREHRFVAALTLVNSY